MPGMVAEACKLRILLALFISNDEIKMVSLHIIRLVLQF